MVNFPPCLLAWTIERRRGDAFIWRDGEQSLTRFPHRGSRRNIYENVSSLSSLSYLPFLQIVSISAYSKFSNRHLWLPSNVRDLSNFLSIAVPAGMLDSFFIPKRRGSTHAHPPREFPFPFDSKLLNILVKYFSNFYSLTYVLQTLFFKTLLPSFEGIEKKKNITYRTITLNTILSPSNPFNFPNRSRIGELVQLRGITRNLSSRWPNRRRKEIYRARD